MHFAEVETKLHTDIAELTCTITQAKWRGSNQDRTFWQRRKVLYTIVKKLSVVGNTTGIQAARDLDRMKGGNGKSHDWVQRNKVAALAWFNCE
jgi:hypothetical protein